MCDQQTRASGCLRVIRVHCQADPECMQGQLSSGAGKVIKCSLILLESGGDVNAWITSNSTS